MLHVLLQNFATLGGIRYPPFSRQILQQFSYSNFTLWHNQKEQSATVLFWKGFLNFKKKTSSISNKSKN